jgi:hypothetical protein
MVPQAIVRQGSHILGEIFLRTRLLGSSLESMYEPKDACNVWEGKEERDYLAM